MPRFGLAFRCFFGLLFKGKLPERAADYLPEIARPPALPEAKIEVKPEVEAKGEAKPKAKAEPKPEAEVARKPPPAEPPPARKPERAADAAEQHRDGALALLALLQREGRLVDFLQESLDDYDDGDIGASVRDIHRGLKKVLTEHLEIEPVMPGEEDDAVTVPRGFDPGEVRLIGEVNGEPPFKGVLRHHGWRVTKASLPTLSEGVDRHVLAPAEVEVS